MRSGALAGASVLGFVLVAAALAVAGSGLGHALYLGALLALLPGLTVAQVPLAAGRPLERAPVYVSSSVLLVLLAGLSYGLGASKVGVEGLGLAPWPGAGPVALWALALVAVAGGVFLVFHLLGQALGVPETSMLADLLPRTPRERGLFVVLSLAAGLGEELAYRGYAISVLTPLVGSAWGAAAVTSAVFGVLHAYQGPLGIVRVGFLGLVLAGGFLVSGSLWPGIVAHAAMDLIGGFVLGERLLRRS